MAQHDRDPAAESHDASEPTAGDGWTTSNVDRPAQAERSETEAIPAPESSSAPAASSAAPKRRRENWHRFTLLAATLGLLATAGSIAAYRFRDKHEKLAAFATVVDEVFARPEKLVAALREKMVKWTGEAAPPAPAAAPEPIELGEIETPPPPAPAPVESKPPEPTPAPSPAPGPNGDHVTWATPGSTPTPAPEPPARPAPQPQPALAAESTNAQIEALTRRVDELEKLAHSALRLAEQANAGAAAPRGDAPQPPQIRELEDNVGGLEGRIDWLSDEMKSLRDKLDASKGETRVDREAEPPPPPAVAETPKGPNPATMVVVAHSLQRALDRGAPFASEYAVLSAHGADSQALAALAPSAEKGAPDPRALRAAFHPLVPRLEASAEPKADAPIGERLLHSASKLVKVRTAADKEKATIGDIAARLEAALDRGEVGAALDAFASLPDDAKEVAREWEEAARRRWDAEKAAASILSGALDALAKSKS